MKFTIIFDKNMVIIEGDDFRYGNINNMYDTESTQGHGLQTGDGKEDKHLLDMCDKIAQAIYDYQTDIIREVEG